MPITTKSDSEILLQQAAQTPQASVVRAEQSIEEFIGPLEAPIETATSETMGSYWRRENIFGSTHAAILDDFLYNLTDEEPDPKYEGLLDVNNSGYEGFEYLLAGALNENHAKRIRGQIDGQREDFETIMNAPTYQHVLSMPLAIADPSILLPASIGVKGLKTANMAKKIGGLAAGGAVGVATQEVGLHLTQDFRSEKESTSNVLAGAILGGLIGGGYGLVTAKHTKANKILQGLSKDLEVKPTSLSKSIEEGNLDLDNLIKQSNESVGAAKLDLTEEEMFAGKMLDREASLADETLVSAKGFEKVLKNVTPLLRNMQSPFLASRRLIQKFVNMPLQKMGGEYEQAITHAVEIAQSGWRKVDVDVSNKMYKTYKKEEIAAGRTPLSLNHFGYTKTTKEWGQRQVNKVASKVGRELPFSPPPKEKTFMTEVADAIENGNVHDNAYIQRAAAAYSKVFEGMADEAMNLGVWSSYPTRDVAKAYFTRIWDADAVLLGEDRLKSILTNYFDTKVDDWVRLNEAKNNKIIQNLERQRSDVEMNKFRTASYLQDAAEVGSKENDFLLSDVEVALELLATMKPKKPKTLLHFIADKGGINIDDFNRGGASYDDVKVWNKNNRIALVNSFEDGGRDLDGLLRMASENGYFPDKDLASMTVDDLMSAIDDELKDIVYYPKNGDFTDINDYQYFKEIEEVVARVGINPKEYAGGKVILTDQKLKDLRSNIIQALDVSAKRRMALIDKKIIDQKGKLNRSLQDLEAMGKKAYVEDLVDETFNKLAKLDSSNRMFDVPLSEVGPLKGLKLDIDNSLIKDFLVRDASQVTEHYVKAVGTDLEFYRKFGSVKFDDIIQPLKREFDDLRIQVRKDKKLSKMEQDSKILELKKSYEDSIDDFGMIYQLLKGGYTGSLYHNPDSILRSAGRMAKMLSYITNMQGVTLSSVPDIGKAQYKEGLGGLFKNGLKSMYELRTGLEKNLLKTHKDDLMSASIAMEHINASRTMNTFDLGNRISGTSVLERTLHGATALTSKLNLMQFYNNFWDDLSGTMFTQQIGRVLKGAGSAKDEKAIKFLGLDQRALKRISTQWDKYSLTGKKGVKIANLDAWTDIEAKRMYKLAMKKSGELVAIRKDIGDTPLAMYQGAWDVITQFKGFMFASMNKTFLAGLQDADRRFLSSIITMVGLGAFTYIVRSAAYGREIDWSPENLLTEGIDRSGVLHLFMEASNIGDRVFGVGARSAMGLGYSSRYTNRSQLGSVLGPSWGLAENYIKAAKSGDIKDIEKLAPFWRLFYVQGLMQALK